METATFVLQISNITIICILCIIAYRDAERSLEHFLGICAAIAIIVHIIIKINVWDVETGKKLGFFSTLGFLPFWWYILVLFDDYFKIDKFQICFGVFWVLAGIVSLPGWVSDNEIVHTSSRLVIVFTMFVLLAYAICKTIIGYKDDLLQARRRNRLAFIVLTLANFTLVTISLFIWQSIYAVDSPHLRLLEMVMILVGVVFILYIGNASDKKAASHSAAQHKRNAESSSKLHNRLLEVMSKNIHRNNELTIEDLAREVGMPEHRLRKVINQNLGYKNFRQFVNSYRLAEAKMKLVAPEFHDVHITTIAMDSGFSSIPSFNRIFKNETGFSPTEYRNLKITD